MPPALSEKPFAAARVTARRSRGPLLNSCNTHYTAYRIRYAVEWVLQLFDKTSTSEGGGRYENIHPLVTSLLRAALWALGRAGGAESAASGVADVVTSRLPPQASPAAAAPARSRMPNRRRLALRAARWLPPHSGRRPRRLAAWRAGHARSACVWLLLLLARYTKAPPTREQPGLCTPGER